MYSSGWVSTRELNISLTGGTHFSDKICRSSFGRADDNQPERLRSRKCKRASRVVFGRPIHPVP